MVFSTSRKIVSFSVEDPGMFNFLQNFEKWAYYILDPPFLEWLFSKFLGPLFSKFMESLLKISGLFSLCFFFLPPATLTKSFPVALYTSMYRCPIWCLCLFKARSRFISLSKRIRASPFLRPCGLKQRATPPLKG